MRRPCAGRRHIFLPDAGEDALGTGALHPRGDARKFLFECFGDFLG